MRKLLLSTAAIAASVAFASPAAAAVCIGTSVGAGAIGNIVCDGGTGTVNYNTTTGGYFYNVSGTGSPIVNLPALLTQSVNIQQAGGANALINVFITQTGITSFGGSLLSAFTSNTVDGVSADVTSFYDASGAQFGTATQLQDHTFNSIGTFSGTNGPLSLTGPWSETVRYSLNFTGGGLGFNGTANLTAVPEPATWGMMLLGFLGIGMVMRRRRNPALAQLA